MFIFTARLTRKRLFVFAGAAVVLLCTVALLLSGHNRAQATNADTPSVKRIKTIEDRIGYLEAHGWEVETESEITQEVIIPQEFDPAFEEYNELQKTQGFDLLKYKGKRVMRYVYTIKNYPEKHDMVLASVLVYKNTIIGGDVQNPTPEGFMHGFEIPGKAIALPTSTPEE